MEANNAQRGKERRTGKDRGHYGERAEDWEVEGSEGDGRELREEALVRGTEREEESAGPGQFRARRAEGRSCGNGRRGTPRMRMHRTAVGPKDPKQETTKGKKANPIEG